MANIYKILKDDVEVIHLAAKDGSLLSIQREFFNFSPEIGQEVEVYQNNNEYIILQIASSTEKNITESYNTLCILGCTLVALSYILAFWGIVAIIGISLSVVGYIQCEKNGEKGKATAIISIIAGIISMLYTLLVLISLGI